MGLAQEARQHRCQQQRQEPRTVHENGRRQGSQGQDILTYREQLREQADPACGLPLRPLQLIVERGVFEMTQIERGGMAYELLADMVGAKIAEQAFDRR